MAGSSAKRLTGIILFIIAAVGVAAFLFLLFADAEGLSVPGTSELGVIAIVAAIILGCIALVLAILLLVRSYDSREEKAETAEAFFIPEDTPDWVPDEVEFRDLDDRAPARHPEKRVLLEREAVVPYDLSEVPLGSGAWGHAVAKGQSRVHTFHYPREHVQALYNNDYITINQGGDQVKLRTLLAAPEGVFDGLRDDPIRPARVKTDKAPARPARPEPVPEPAPKRPAPKPYYDFEGDVDPVIDVEGIGPVYEKKLAAIGVQTTARLCYEDPESLARAIDAPAKTVRLWQTMAEFMKVSGIGGQYAEVLARAGVDGIDALKRRSAQSIADDINAFLDNLEANVIGNKITAKRVEGWKAKAAGMRRVRLQVPEE